MFKVYEEAFKLKENSEKTNTKITHEISTQTDNILVNSLPSVSKYSEKRIETNNPVLSQNSHGSQGSSSQSIQENKTGPENVDIKNLEYNVEVSNIFAALDPLQAKHKQVTPPKVNKYSTVRKLTEKFQHLIIGSSITKLIDSKYLNKQSQFFTCVRTLSGAHYIDIYNYLKGIKVHRDTTRVTVVAGANDCCSRKSKEEIQLELDQLIKLLQTKFHYAKIQFVEPIKRRGALRERYNKNIQELCEHLARIAKVEKFPVLFINDKLQVRKELYEDLVHLSQSGTAILMGEIKKFWNTGRRYQNFSYLNNRSYKFGQNDFNYWPIDPYYCWKPRQRAY